MIGKIASICLFVFPGIVFSQTGDGLKEICLGLTNNQLIDQFDLNSAIDRQSSEFRFVCSSDTNYLERFNQTSGSAKASFFGVGSGSGSGAQTGSVTELQIKQQCDIGEVAFKERVKTQIRYSSGTNLAGLLVQCADIYSKNKEEKLIGWTSTTEDDKQFIVDLRFSSFNNISYELYNIAPELKCSYRSENALGSASIAPNSALAFVCDKPVGSSPIGTFTFKPPNVDQTRAVSFAVNSRDRERELESQVADRIHSEVATLRNELLGRTNYRIASFGQADCVPNEGRGATYSRNEPWVTPEECKTRVSLDRAMEFYDVFASLQQSETNDFPSFTIDITDKTPTGFTLQFRVTYGQLSRMAVNYIVIERDG